MFVLVRIRVVVLPRDKHIFVLFFHKDAFLQINRKMQTVGNPNELVINQISEVSYNQERGISFETRKRRIEVEQILFIKDVSSFPMMVPWRFLM